MIPYKNNENSIRVPQIDENTPEMRIINSRTIIENFSSEKELRNTVENMATEPLPNISPIGGIPKNIRSKTEPLSSKAEREELEIKKKDLTLQ